MTRILAWTTISALLLFLSVPAGAQGTSPPSSASTLDPSELRFDIGEGVPSDELEMIRTGIDLGRAYLRNVLGGDIPLDVRRTIAVKVVATGKGNQEPGGGGSCCTGMNQEGLARLFIDVRHPHWNQPGWSPERVRRHKLKTAAHEYFHAWQNALGCSGRRYTDHWVRFEGWLEEGAAEYVGYSALVATGTADAEDVKRFMVQAAVSTNQAKASLAGLEYIDRSYEIWPGHLGYLAVDLLVTRSPAKVLSVRIHCTQVRIGADLEKAFARAFGMPKDVFYPEFAAYFEELRRKFGY